MVEWVRLRLSDISVNYDSMRRPVKSTERRPGPYPYYGASGVVDHVDGYLFDGDYVLVSEDGENLRTRTTPIAFVASGKFWVNNHAHILQGNDIAETRYLAHLLEQSDISGYLSGSTQPKLTQAALNRMELLVPERWYQEAVVAVLGALDDKIAVNDRIESTYEKLLALQFGKLDIDDETDASIVASDLIEFNPRTKTPTVDAVYLEMSALPTASARIREWSRREPKSGARFANGDTVMARITPCLENGKTGFVDFMRGGEVGVGSTEFIVMRARAGVPVHLPYFLARSPRFRSIAIQNMVGSSGRQRVSASSLESVAIRRPREDELLRFDAEASAAFAHMRSLGQESANLAGLRDVLLPKLMSGEIRVRDAEKAVEDAL